jgi:tetratricopeptide (TPR) repeat protein
MHRSWAWLLVLMGITGFSGAILAQTAGEPQCPASDPDLSVSGCTAVIQSGGKTHENLAAAFNNRGLAYVKKGEYDRAIQDYDEAIRLDPNFAKAFNNRGAAYAAKGENDRAIQDYDEAIRLNPNEAIPFGNRGFAYDKKGQYDRAIQDFDKVIQLNPNDAKAFYIRGLAYDHKGQYDRAIQDYDGAIRLDPNDAIAFWGRANAYDKKGQYDREIQDFDKVIRLMPNNADAFYNRGNAYDKKGQYDRAIQDYGEAIRLNPNSTMALENRGNTYRIKGQYDRAIQDLDEAIRLNPNDAKAFHIRGLAYDDKGQDDRAIQDFDQAIRLNPNDAEAFHNRGRVYTKKGQYDRAIQAYDEATRLNPNYAEAFYNRGLAYAGKGQDDRALQDYDEAIRRKPNLAEAFNNRGRLYTKKGQFDRAIQDFDQAIRLNPNYAIAFYNRGVLLHALGQEARSAADLAKARSFNPAVQEPAAESRPTGPSTGQGRAAVSPSDDQLDALLAAKDWNGLGAAISRASNDEALERAMNWLRSRLDAGGSSFLGFLLAKDLWAIGSSGKIDDPDKDPRVSAGMIFLYTLELITIDGVKCEDRSALGNRTDQLFMNYAPTLAYLKAEPAEVKAKAVDLAIELEQRTAPLRKDDDFICRGGMTEMIAGLKAGTPHEVPDTGGHIGKTFGVAPPPDWAPKFAAPENYKPIQDQMRAEMKSHLAELVGLSLQEPSIALPAQPTAPGSRPSGAELSGVPQPAKPPPAVNFAARGGGIRAVVAELRRCLSAVRNNPAYGALLPHLNDLSSDPRFTATQLADDSTPSQADAAALQAYIAERTQCQDKWLADIDQILPPSAPIRRQLMADTQVVLTGLVDRQMTWGAAAQRAQQLLETENGRRFPNALAW